MRILLLANKGSNHAKKCAEGLADRGHEIFFVSPNDQVDSSVTINPKVHLITMKYGGKKGYILNCLELRRLFNKIKPDVVNVHYASGCGMLSLLAGIHPIVLNCYGSDIFEFPHLSKLNCLILKLVLRNSDALASTSHAMANEIRNISGNNLADIAITPFGVDTERFKPVIDKKTNNRPKIGIVKSLLPVYDIPLLIKSFAIVYRQAELKPVLEIYGDGPLKKELEELVCKLALSEAVHFMGRIPNRDVPKVLNNLDVFVNCSLQESFGVNILEAMACELPVVATDCVGPKELIEDGISGIILKERKPVSLANALISLLSDLPERERLGKAGRERVLALYDWNKNVESLERVLKNKSRIKR